MAERFFIPEKLTPLDSINCAKHIKSCPPSKEYVYDFSDMQFCHPFGLLLIGNAIRWNKAHYSNANHHIVGVGFNQGTRFAADLGFFQYIGWDIGRKTNPEDYGVRHIPIKRITIKDLQKQQIGTLVLGDLIDYYSGELAMTLTQDATSETTKTLQYCLREMIRNSFEHGKVEEVWVCGVFWPSRNEAEIAIIDEGCGIWGSLRTNRKYKLRSDQEANKLALQPGASRMAGQYQDPYDAWQNSGFGLFMASALCCLGGYFILGSGQDTTLINRLEQVNYQSNIKGTAICMNLRTNKINNLQSKLDELAALGSAQARENSDLRILTASKVSTIASLLRDVSPTDTDNNE